MDYKDFLAGQTEKNFWFNSKKKLINILLNKIGQKKLKILDIGAGTGIDLDIINQFGEVYLIDINKKALDLIPKNMCKEKKICTITKITYPDNYFDVVCSFDVFEHINDDIKAVSEVRRVLKKGGFLIFTVPAFNFLYSAHDKAALHYRRYSRKSLLNLLKLFINLEISYWNYFLFFPLSIIRILKKKSKPKLDYLNLPRTIERIFSMLLNIENSLISKNYKLPLGLSLIGSCSK